jgi:Ala-tRNA(Pro) deacylase
MAIAPKLQDFLAARRSEYQVLAHPRTQSSAASAQAAHVPGRRFAKAVVVEDDEGYVLAVVPSTHHLALSELGEALHRRPLRLARESELGSLFPDCELGALPALGDAYGIPTIVEKELDAQQDVYFEAGDHEHMVHMSGTEFARASAEAGRAHFSRIDPGLSRLSGGPTA